MIKDLDKSLKTLFQKEAAEGSVLEKAKIYFAAPDQEWRKKLSGLVLNVYLYDVRENRNLRTNEILVKRNPGGTITQKKPSPRMECSYLITTWNKPDNQGEEEKELQEHRLLSQVLQVLLRYPTIPPEYLEPSLVTQEPPLPLIVAQRDGLSNPVEFWSALGSPFKPSINCLVTISLDVEDAVTDYMVISKILEYAQVDKPEQVEKFIQIGGMVIDKTDKTKRITEAEVTITASGRKTKTDEHGFYAFSNLTEGEHEFQVVASGYKIERKKIKIPVPKGKNYDMELTKQ